MADPHISDSPLAPTGSILKGTIMSMSDPIQSAYEKFEAARLIHDANNERVHKAYREAEAALGPRPDRAGKTLSQRAQWTWWHAQQRRLVGARLGTDERVVADEPDPYRDRLESAEKDLSKIEATSLDEILCQLRAWWTVEECCIDEDSSEGLMILRLLKDLERLAGESRS